MYGEATLSPMTHSDGDKITVEYVGRLEDGTVFDTSDAEYAEEVGLADENPDRIFEPLTIELGEGNVIPGLEDGLREMDIGDQTMIEVPPEQAYGPYNEDKIGEYERDAFENMLGHRELKEGFEVKTETGLFGRVTDYDEETVIVDYNHELAGELLRFEIEVVDVEPGSEDES